jgi:hypothetical protein
MKKKGRPVTISLRKIGLYRDRSETPMMDFMRTVRVMERISNLEDENKRLKAELSVIKRTK